MPTSPFEELGVVSGDCRDFAPSEQRLTVAEARRRAERAARRLAEESAVRLVFLFGSTVDPVGETVGDVDLGIVTHPTLSLAELLDLRATAVAEAGGPIDLVQLDDAPVVLCWEVVRHGECLYAADPEERLAFVLRSQQLYWDFKPVLDRSWALIGQRIEERRRRGSQA